MRDNFLLRCCCPAVLLAVFLSALPADCMGQFEPQVRVRVQSCEGSYCSTYYGNGVIVADNDGLLVLTCAHVVRAQGPVSVFVGGNWYPAQTYRVNETDDVAAVVVPGRFGRLQVPNWASLSSAPDGTDVEIRSYWPGNWQPVSRRVRRLATRLHRCIELQNGVPSGVSGSPVYSSRGLIGIVSAADNRSTIVVPITVIQQHYIRWGLLPAPAQPPVEQDSPNYSTVPGGSLTQCDCQSQFSAIEQRLAGLSQRIDSVSVRPDSRPEIAALQEHVTNLQSQLSNLERQPGPQGPRGPQGEPGPARTVTVILKDDKGKQLTGPITVPPGASTVTIPVIRYQR